MTCKGPLYSSQTLLLAQEGEPHGNHRRTDLLLGRPGWSRLLRLVVRPARRWGPGLGLQPEQGEPDSARGGLEGAMGWAVRPKPPGGDDRDGFEDSHYSPCRPDLSRGEAGAAQGRGQVFPTGQSGRALFEPPGG